MWPMYHFWMAARIGFSLVLCDRKWCCSLAPSQSCFTSENPREYCMVATRVRSAASVCTSSLFMMGRILGKLTLRSRAMPPSGRVTAPIILPPAESSRRSISRVASMWASIFSWSSLPTFSFTSAMSCLT